MPAVDQHALNLATELTKQAIASSPSSYIGNPQAVAKFLEVICAKISELKSDMKEPKS